MTDKRSLRKFRKKLDKLSVSLSENPDNVKLLIEKSDLLFNMDRYDECINTCNKVVKLEPSNQQINFMLANALFKAKDFKSSLNICESLISYKRKDTYFRLKFDILHSVGKHEEAINVYENNLDKPNKEDLIKLVDTCFEIGQYEKSLMYCEKCQSIYGKNINLSLKEASLLNCLFNYKESLSVYEIVAEQIIDSKLTHIKLDVFYKLLQINPDDCGAAFYYNVFREFFGYTIVTSYEEINDLFLKQKLYHEGFKVYSIAMGIIPDSELLQNANNDLVTKFKNIDDKQAVLLKAEVFYNEGLSYAKTNKTKALKNFNNAYKLFITETDYENALKAINSSIELNPNNANLWYNKGEILEQLERIEDAIISYEKGAEIWKCNKEYKKAVHEYSRIIDLNPKYPAAHFKRAEIFEKLGNIDKARIDYRQASRFWGNTGHRKEVDVCKSRLSELDKSCKEKEKVTSVVTNTSKCYVDDKKPYTNITKIALDAENGLSYEEYYETNLKPVSSIHGLALADDELLLYTLYKKNGGLFAPTLKYSFTGYKEEYAKLSSYFTNQFFELLKERVSLTDSVVIDERNYKKVKDNFIYFRNSIGHLMDHFMLNNEYYGISEVNPVLLLFKKMLARQGIPSDYIDYAGYGFVPGSALFFLELYSLLKEEHILETFQNEIQNVQDFNSVLHSPELIFVPWDHQMEAFSSWENRGCNGILEMATATGKTLVGIMAIEKASKLTNHSNVRIFAHSRAILNQWRREVIEKMGLLENQNEEYIYPIRCNGVTIYFQTLQSVYNNPGNYPADLLIVDEVHHGAANEYKKALNIECNWKLGLSATIEGGMKKNILEKQLGPVVYKFGLKEALERGVLPKFDWKLHTTYLSFDEAEQFTEISKQILELFNYVKNDKSTILMITKNPSVKLEYIYDFVKLTEMARYKGIDIPSKWKNLQGKILERRWIIHKSRPKIEEAIELAISYLHAKKKVIIFTMDIETCDEIGARLSNCSNNIFIVHSQIKSKVNQRIMNFKKADHGILIGAKMLDEGIDIPDAEIGINVSSSKTRLQLIQRLGRVLRKKGNKKPIFHHYLALPTPDSYIDLEDNLRYMDDLSWAQDTALKIGIVAEVQTSKPKIETIRLDAESMVRKRYEERSTLPIKGYGTMQIENMLKPFDRDVCNNLIHILGSIDQSKRISDTDWSSIVRHAFNKKDDDALDVPFYWWLLVLSERKPVKLIDLFKQKLRV